MSLRVFGTFSDATFSKAASIIVVSVSANLQYIPPKAFSVLLSAHGHLSKPGLAA